MNFADLAKGDSVFVDANSLVYHFAPDPIWGAACTELLVRIKSQELAGGAVSHQHGLLTNDALLVAVMNANSITNLASSHTDFDRVPSINRYAPA
ncbi:MAG: hypothetical protein HY040_16860 [Planctomycetes bacterium]|nr:hypothetical protein [Planctomycetota bacterium]